jgi:hypothetical protein
MTGIGLVINAALSVSTDHKTSLPMAIIASGFIAGFIVDILNKKDDKND